MEIAFRAGDAQPARAHRLEMRAARDKGDVHARRREPPAKITADAAAPDNCNPHSRRSYHDGQRGIRRAEFFSPRFASSALIVVPTSQSSIGTTRVPPVPTPY